MPIDSRITLQKLEIFELIVEHGGVTHAADHLMVAPSVVSAHLRLLERRVGAALFQRKGRRLELTEAGLVVHRWAADLQERTREMSRKLDGLSGGVEGVVAIASSMSLGAYVLPSILVAFREQRPLVAVRLEMSDAAHAVADVESGATDFAVVAMGGAVLSRALATERIGSEGLVLLAPTTGLVDGGEVGTDELSRLPFIDGPTGLVRRALIDRELRRLGVHERQVVLELGHPEAVKQAVIAGAGVALLTHSAVSREIATGTARIVEVRGADLCSTVHLVHRRDRLLSPTHLGLIAAIKQHYAGS